MRGCVLFLFMMVCLSSCIYDPPIPTYKDITVINNTRDSLYYHIHPYNSVVNYSSNFAFDSLASHDKTPEQYKVAYNINKYKIASKDTLKPQITREPWKELAKKYGGLTLIFYKREIQQLPKNVPPYEHNIYRTLNFNPKQLDSLNYIIELN
jgi:hypothetical protein